MLCLRQCVEDHCIFETVHVLNEYVKVYVKAYVYSNLTFLNADCMNFHDCMTAFARLHDYRLKNFPVSKYFETNFFSTRRFTMRKYSGFHPKGALNDRLYISYERHYTLKCINVVQTIRLQHCNLSYNACIRQVTNVYNLVVHATKLLYIKLCTQCK